MIYILDKINEELIESEIVPMDKKQSLLKRMDGILIGNNYHERKTRLPMF